ncbi:thiamine-phosphate kinase [Moritella sp. F3]|uniref:thiamine-phosphate kinase n=1 Tax=Moritella sp. F3 TaxID=2718882 RepID=UPI0018E10BE5|nr:thiamine-phosphate kinase [Moritella sp. F3]GIC77306.1 thiamine-monophosphate kinase [Moritella sp. F1]GIC83166.1 thiamine-monophosphate kinase [Moritella sp. F3]
MATGEFDLIGQYFTNKSVSRDDVIAGIGDDCAILSVPVGKQLVVTTDTMVRGIHFLPDADPADVAHKLVAVNISDIAAMGGKPAWASLAITLPDYDHAWLTAFSDCLHQQLHRYGVSLIGGDTTKGDMTLTLTLQGFVEQGLALRRQGAQAGDLIYCSGTIGDANAGLKLLIDAGNRVCSDAEKAFLIARHQRPTARVSTGQALVGIANSCIDLSDGLASDLQHILKASSRARGVTLSANIELTALPLSNALQTYVSKALWPQYALAGGDDYELLFTVSPENKAKLEQAMADTDLPCTQVGVIIGTDITKSKTAESETVESQIHYYNDKQLTTLALQGWDHFQ